MLTLVHASCKGSRRPTVLYHTQLATMSFDEIFDLTAGGVYFVFYNKFKTVFLLVVLAIRFFFDVVLSQLASSVPDS